MRRLKKLTAVFVAAGMCFSFAFGTVSGVHRVSAEEIVYEGYDMSRMDNLVSEYENALKAKNNSEEVRSSYYRLIGELDYVNLQNVLSQVQYSQNTSEENLNECSKMSTAEMQCFDLVVQAIAESLGTDYGVLISMLVYEGLIQTDADEKYTLKPEDDIAVEEKNELLNSYLKILSSSDSADVKNLKCAGIYLKLVKCYNSMMETDDCTYFDYAYQLYSRDYTPEDISKMNSTAAEAVYDAWSRIYEYSETIPYTPERIFNDNMDIISRYSYRISDELRESAEEITEKNLYRTGSGSSAQQMCYTLIMSYYRSAVIYQYLYGNSSDFSAAVHEFGHFNADRQCNMPFAYIHSHNLDLAEVHSQGLEVLYTSFYDGMYGAHSDFRKADRAAALVSSVAAGFMGNEFEDYVFRNADNLTPEQVLDKYNELTEKYVVYDVDFYLVSHFFQYPGYYISYAVSALAALNLWEVMYRDYDEAVRMYTELSHISVYDGTGFSEALMASGFDDILDPEYLCSILSDFTDMITSALVFGDTDGNGTVNTADILYLISAVISPEGIITDENISVFDVTGDGKSDAADIVRLKRLLSR